MAVRADSGDHHHGGRGPTSFGMHDAEAVFSALDLKPGQRVLDLGCGPGDYCMRAAQLVGPQGKVWALDKDQETLRRLEQRALAEGLRQIHTVLSDLSLSLPVQDACVDLALAATVLHIFPWPKFDLKLFGEIKRVLKSAGRLAVIECQKEDQPWGPPKKMRISPEELERGLAGWGLVKAGYVDLGKTYLMQFGKE